MLSNGIISAVGGGALKGTANYLLPNRGLPSLSGFVSSVPEGQAVRRFTTESSEYFDRPYRNGIEFTLGTSYGAATQAGNVSGLVSNVLGPKP